MDAFLLALRNHSLAACIALAGAVSHACGLDKPNYTEVLRVPNAAGDAVVVLFEGCGGTAADYCYELFVESTALGQKTSVKILEADDTRRNEDAGGMNVVWLDAATIGISYHTSWRFSLLASEVELAGKHFKIRVSSGVEDAGAPPGSMEYNLDPKARH